MSYETFEKWNQKHTTKYDKLNVAVMLQDHIEKYAEAVLNDQTYDAAEQLHEIATLTKTLQSYHRGK